MSEAFVLVLLLGVFALFVRWLWREEAMLWAGSDAPMHRVALEARRERVLFVCTHNSARSQMAEALLRDMTGDRFHVGSAGTSPTSVHPLAEAAIGERGLSLRLHRSKHLSEMGTRWDYVITLCDQAFEECPDFPPKTSHLHWSIEDPVRPRETPDEQLDAFCRVCDELAVRLRRWVDERREVP